MIDINDIKELEKYGINPAVFWYAGLAVLFAALLAGLVYFLKKRKRRVPEFEAVISAEVSALDLLDDLQGRMDSDAPKFYFELSMILREYIRLRFGLGAPEMTSEELLINMARIPISDLLARDVREFVHASDPVKFAGRPAEPRIMQRHIEFVRKFVYQTTADSADEKDTPEKS